MRICEAKFGIMYAFDGEHSIPQSCYKRRRRLSNFTAEWIVLAGTGTQSDRADTKMGPSCRHSDGRAYPDGDPLADGCVEAEFAPCRRPHVKESELVGAFVIYRQEVRPFTDKQIELVKTSPPRPSSR